VGAAGYSVLVAIFGAGFVVGSLSGAGDADLPELKRRYLLGILLAGASLVVAVVPSFPVVAIGLAMAGLGNGVTLVNERLLCQRVVPDSVLARAFAVFDSAGSWAFAIAFLGAGAVLSFTGTRPLLVVAGLGCVAIWALAHLGLRGLWEPARGDEPAGAAAPRPPFDPVPPSPVDAEPAPARPLPPAATAAGRASTARPSAEPVG
jgi:MFS family permease